MPCCAGARVAGERDPGARVGAEVAEHHRHHVDRGAQVGGDPLLPPVEHGAVGVPRVEHGIDGQVHLLVRLLGEVAPGVRADDLLETFSELVQVPGVQIKVVGGALGLLGLVDRVLERVPVDAEHGLAEHLDQPPVGVPGEPLVPGLLGEPVHGLVGDADVQDGVHHPWHGELGPGPDADQQRVGRVAELPAHGLLHPPQMLADLRGKPLGDAAMFQVVTAGLGGDSEARRHGQADVGHLGKVRALAAQQVLQVLVAFAECVDELRHCTLSLCPRRRPPR